MNRVRFAIAAIGLLCSFAAFAQVSGVATTVNASGVPQKVFDNKDEVFFTAGPTDSDCAFPQFVSDGAYYFQVTDVSGKRLLSSDPIGERIVTVRKGVLETYDATTHAVEGAEEARGPCGGLRVRVGPFEDAGHTDVTYLLWLTPVDRYADPEKSVAPEAVEGLESTEDGGPACAEGCFHGFVRQFSLTTTFRVEDRRICDESFCVSGVKYEDRNGNGVRDSGEPGIPGVTIHLEQTAEGDDDDDDDFVGVDLVGLTGADGAYLICGVPHTGTFRITESVPFGFEQTGPIDDRPERQLIARDFAWFVIQCDEDFDGLDFGNRLIPNAIGGIKFEDLNANGVRDPGEPGLAGFTITLTPTTPGAPAQTVTTDANGNFIFLNVAPGSYTLSETLQQGFSLTLPANNVIPVTLDAGGSSITNTFGNFRGVLTGTVTGVKFNDLNGNGIRDAGEPGLAGVTITRTGSINDPAGTPLSVVTDAQGNFTFANVPFGTFTLTETVPVGFAQTAPAPPGTNSATINFAQRTVSGLLFGNRALVQPGTVSGEKFNDANGNGVRDAGEGGLSGVTIRLTDSSGTVRTAVTNSAGAFSFADVTPGAYTVSEVVPSGFTQTAPAAPGTFAVNLTAGQAVTGLLFGNRTTTPGTNTASIAVRKILDFEGNGIFDGNDRGFEGIVFELTDAAGTVRRGTSDAQGNFTFTNLPAGTYVLSEVLPPNFFQTFPGTTTAPGTYTITLTDGQAATGFLFLNKC